MENLRVIDMESEDVGEDQWHIKTDAEAEWWIEVKEEDLVEVRRFQISLNNKIALLKEQLDKVNKEEKQIIANRDFYLQEYFKTIGINELKKTKTQAKYRLPSVELIEKYPKPDFKRDEVKLVQWFKDNDMKEFIKTEIVVTPKWGEFKEQTQTVGKQVIHTETGLIVEGVEVVEKDPEFKVEVKF